MTYFSFYCGFVATYEIVTRITMRWLKKIDLESGTAPG